MASMPRVGVFIALCFCLFVNDAFGIRCNRYPKNVNRKSKLSGDGDYRILIDGNPTGYQPGKIYNGNV